VNTPSFFSSDEDDDEEEEEEEDCRFSHASAGGI